LEERFARLEETVHVCRTLWREAPASYQGRWTSFEGAYSRPAPHQSPGIPIWVGGWPGMVQARRVARLADGWIFNTAATPGDVAQSMTLLADACAEIGRDSSTIPVRAMVPSARRLGLSGATTDDKLVALRTYATSLVDAGATHVSVSLASYARDVDEAQHLVTALAGHFATMRERAAP
jgi:alkanesulfonate monooxygenase SsuD/methylene tetrahydromethanopterin reductase-like flavin-dependent oxidoreductase (luciferase family)